MRQYSTAGVRILEDITCDVIPRDAALDAFDIVAGRILAQSRTASFGSWSRSRTCRRRASVPITSNISMIGGVLQEHSAHESLSLRSGRERREQARGHEPTTFQHQLSGTEA